MIRSNHRIPMQKAIYLISRFFPLLTVGCKFNKIVIARQWQGKKPVCGVQYVKRRHVSGWCRFSCTGAYSYHPIQVRLHTWNGFTRHTLSEDKRRSRELPMICCTVTRVPGGIGSRLLCY